jgi:nitrate reductase gamma subunit
MFFDITLYIALTIFGIGMLYKLYSWLHNRVGLASQDISTSRRILSAIKGCILTIFSIKIFVLIKAFILDVVLQLRLLKDGRGFYVWLMHMCIYGGFTFLLLMHGLDKVITSSLFVDYYPTVNPFLFLRNLFGVLVLIGLALAVIRRTILKKHDVTNSATDYYAIIILTVIMLSGFLLEGLKMNSYSTYQSMVEEYAFLQNEEARALETFWVKEFGVVSPNKQETFGAEALALGKELSDISCDGCHSSAKWAFIGYATAKISRPVALHLDRAGVPVLMWYIHFLSCFFGLAYLPFSKMFHLFATPVSILVNAAVDEGKSDPANVATKLSIELDGCRHGGACHLGCPIRQKRQQGIDAVKQCEPLLGYLAENLRVGIDK